MLGNMMNNQLLISGVIEHAEKYHSDAVIFSRTVEGPIHRYTYSDAAKRSRKLANALVNLGLKEGDTIVSINNKDIQFFNDIPEIIKNVNNVKIELIRKNKFIIKEFDLLYDD